MKKRTRIVIYTVIVVFAAIILSAMFYIYKAMPIGTGYMAKYVCSQVFLADRDPDFIVNEEVKPYHFLFAMATPKIDRDKKEVTAATFGLLQKRRAIYRDWFGCTLTIDTTRDELFEQAEGARPGFDNPENMEWPRGEKVSLEANPAKIDMKKLDAALEYAFSETMNGVKVRTQAVVVVYKGRIIAERYADHIRPQTPLLGWSMSKSITGALIGLLVKDGKLDVEKPAPIREWRDPEDPRSEITLNNLMRMNSGLEFEEVYGPFADATDMLYGEDNMAKFASSKPLEHEPGRAWYYSTGTTNILTRIARESVGGSLADIQNFLHDRLLKPLHMATTVMEPDASGNYVGSSYTFGTARDWARLGLFFLNNGRWEGKQLLPEGWINYMTTPTEGSHGQYGAQLWINRAEKKTEEVPYHYPELAKSVYWMGGFNMQRVMMFPENDLVLVRFGVTHDQKSFDMEGFALKVLESIGEK